MINHQKIDKHTSLPLDPDAARPGIAARLPHKSLRLQVIVFVGGGLGTVARYGFSNIIATHANQWPWATFIVNLLGAFLLGFLLELLLHVKKSPTTASWVRLAIGTGFIGAFTTYSSMAVEIDLLISHKQLVMATGYAASSIVGGIFLVALGIRLAMPSISSATRKNS